MKLLRDIGEFGLIERIRGKIKPARQLLKGIGDDAAVIKFSRDRYLLLTCDMLVEDVHFNCNSATPYQIGWKALGASISDIASMGGLPREALISLGLPPGLTVRFIDRLYSGLKRLANTFAVNLAGGDTVRSEKVVISVALTGIVKKKNLVLRSTAKCGDAILVTGSLGGAIFKKHLNFMPRLKEAQYLVNRFKINSMIDISDGLIQDLGHITEESKVGAVIYQKDIPVSAKRDFELAIRDGEDFELLFTMPRDEARDLLSSSQKVVDIPISLIGEIVSKRGISLVDRRLKAKRLRVKGWQHF
jgi:thiamine-monophosphate kinase